MKIVVLDGYTENPGDLSWEGFEHLGAFTCYDRTPEDQVVARIGDAEAVIINKTPITKETLDRCPKVRYIGVLATGYNVVDVQAAKEKGIVVSNIPTYGTSAVAQHTFALLLEATSHVGHHADSVAKGEWSKNADWCYWDYPLFELYQKTMGIIGFGRIGQDVAKIANAFGMEVLAYDQYPNKDLETDNLHYVELDELFSKADILSLHCPLFPSTEGIINKASIAKMKDGVIIINTSRGPLVVEPDMRAALDAGKVGYYLADVVAAEPIREDNPLLGAKNCLITPHIAWAPKESRARLMEIAVKNLAAFVNGTPQNVVNP